MIMVKCCLMGNYIRMSQVEKYPQLSSGSSVVIYSLNNTLLCPFMLRSSFSSTGTDLDMTLQSWGIHSFRCDSIYFYP